MTLALASDLQTFCVGPPGISSLEWSCIGMIFVRWTASEIQRQENLNRIFILHSLAPRGQLHQPELMQNCIYNVTLWHEQSELPGVHGYQYLVSSDRMSQVLAPGQKQILPCTAYDFRFQEKLGRIHTL